MDPSLKFLPIVIVLILVAILADTIYVKESRQYTMVMNFIMGFAGSMGSIVLFESMK